MTTTIDIFYNNNKCRIKIMQDKDDILSVHLNILFKCTTYPWMNKEYIKHEFITYVNDKENNINELDMIDNIKGHLEDFNCVKDFSYSLL